MAANLQSVPACEGLQTYNDTSAPEVDQPGLEPQQPIPQVYYYQEQPYDPRHGKLYPKYAANEVEAGKQGRRTCGLRRPTFWLVVLLILVIVTAAAVGGGVGGAQAEKAAAVEKNNALPGAKLTSTASGAATSDHTSVPTNTPLSISVVTAAGSTVTVTAASLAVSATPSSDCQADSGTDYVGTDSKLSYKRICNANLAGGSTTQDIIATPQPTFEDCIGMCDSYNWYNRWKNMTVVIWNWNGNGEQTPGTCWCEHAIDYKLEAAGGQDMACLVGTFTESDLPS